MAEKVEYILSIKDLFTKTIRSANDEVNGLEKSLGRTNSIAKSFRSVFATLGAAWGANQILESTAKIEGLNNSIKFISGTTEEANKNFAFLKATSDKLGTSLLSSEAGFKTIAGAARGTSLEGEATRQVFLGISQASARMGLSGEQSEGALLALGQMISKGKVQAEELRGQLGERIPGAFQIAARAMNMTTAQLDKFMSQGKLVAEDFVPKFAAQLQKEFGGNVPESIQATLNRFENLKTELMTSLIPAVGSILKAMMSFIGFLKENSTEVKTFAVFVGILAGGMLLYNGYVAITLGLTRAWTVAQALLNGTMALNPIGIVVTAVAALGAAFYYAYQKSERFRYTIAGLFQIIKDIGAPLGQILAGLAIMPGNPIAGAKLVAAGAKGFSNFSFKDSFNKGYDLKKQDEYFSKAKGARIAGYTYDQDKNFKGGTSLGTSAGSGGGSLSGVSGGKPTHITINITKLVEKLEVHSTNLNASAQRITEEVKKALLTAVNDSQLIAQ